MRIGPQPKGARGTVGHPYSALNLRLVLAVFGLVSCGVLAGLLLSWRYVAAGAIAGIVAVLALVDLVVIQLRRRRRAQADPDRHSLFE